MPLLSTFGAASARGFGNLSGIALPSDDEFNRVSFMSHFDGANSGNNSAYDDSSTSNHTITQVSRVWQGSFGPFARPEGEWGWSFDGSGDNLKVPDSTDFDCGTGDFCLELFIFSGGAASNPILITFGGGFYLQLKDSMTDISFYTGSTEIVYSGSASLTDNAWHHIAITREGSSLRHFLDGSLVKTTSNSDAVNGSGEVLIGTNTNGSSLAWTGLISNLRLVNGSAVYTSAFTVPTSKLTAVTNTKLLTCQSNRFVDNSASAHTVTPSGNTAVTASGPFLTDAAYDPAVNGASAFFAGSGDSLTAPDSADFDFGSGNYTVELWIYPRTTGTLQGLFNHWGDFNTNNVAWSVEYHSNGNIQYYIKTNNGVSTLVGTGGASTANRWMHIAAVRYNNVHTLYLDGVSKATVTDAGTMNNCTSTLIVGDYFDNNYSFDGEICDARIVKGTAVYTGNFTPPTAPLTAITNTKLLLNMANGQIIDNAAQSIAREVGSPVISTAQAKFGDTSLSVSGSSSVKFNEYGYSGFAFGTGDFTIEFWYYGDSTQNDYLFDTRLANDNEARASVYFNSNSKLSYYTSNTTRITSTTALTNNTWTHIALVRSSAVTRFYFNGTQDNQSFSDTLDMPSAQLVIGSKWNGTAFVTGYFDDFRVSKMARYTGNFTAPAEPFADKGQ